MTKIIKTDKLDGQLMNDTFDFYYIASKNQLLMKGKGEFKDKAMLMNLDNLEMA